MQTRRLFLLFVGVLAALVSHARSCGCPDPRDPLKIVPSTLFLEWDRESDNVRVKITIDRDGTVREDKELSARLDRNGDVYRKKDGKLVLFGTYKPEGRFYFADAKDKAGYLLVDKDGTVRLPEHPNDPLFRFRDDGWLEGPLVGPGKPGDGIKYVGPKNGRLTAALAIVAVFVGALGDGAIEIW
jgi:hypothetical protein